MTLVSNIATFVAVVHAGSFAAAGRQLNLSSAMVGRRIQTLEDHYGIKLIERTTRVQRLTTAGEEFFRRAELLMQAVTELDEVTRGAGTTLSGRVRLTGPTTLGIKKVAQCVAAFQSAHPAVIVEMTLTDRRVDLIAEGFDFAVRIGELQTSSLIARRVGIYRFAVCVAPGWLDHNGMPASPYDLETVPCILNLNMRPRNKWPFTGPNGRIEIEVQSGLEIDNGEAQRAAALGGAGIVYLPEELVRDDIEAGTLVHLFPDWPTMTMPIWLVHPTRNLVPSRVIALMDAVALALVS